MNLFAHLIVVAAAAVAFAASAQDKAVAPAKPKLDLAKAEATYGAVCAACHGADGNSGTPANPKLAGQHPEFLAQQLADFKSGKRNNAVMKGFASTLSEADMQAMGAWLSAKKPKSGFAKDKALVAQGERIYRGGIADRQVPACAGCHSPNGAGIPSQYPRLAGQHAEYVATRLTVFRDNALQAGHMNSVAAKMNDREIKAVADYIAGLR